MQAKLNAKLKEMASSLGKGLSANALENAKQAQEHIDAKHIENTALALGSVAPEFSLTDSEGACVSSKVILEKGPIVLSFYRGGWCPYCNVQLQELITVLGEIETFGATLLAISPESPAHTKKTKAKHKLPYMILSDRACKLAEQFGLTYDVPEAMHKIEGCIGVDLQEYNDDTSNCMAVPATFIIDKASVVRFVDVHANPAQRTEPQTILTELRKLV